MSCLNSCPGPIECRPIYVRTSYNVIVYPGFDGNATIRTARDFNALVVVADIEHIEQMYHIQKRHRALRAFSASIISLSQAMTKAEYEPENKGTRKPWTKAERYKKRFF